MMRLGKEVSWVVAGVFAVALAGCCDSSTPLGVRESGAGGPAVVVLGTTSTFGVLAGSSVANTGATTITGDLGVSPGSTVTGFPPGTVSGTIHTNDAAAIAAQTALTAAFNDVNARTASLITVAGDLGATTLSPGLYASTSSLALSGTVTLNALGHSNAIFIIRTASTLTTAAGSHVVLTGGAKASNVIWLVGTSATLGANSDFQGIILADQSVTMNTGAHLVGSALARTGAVTLDTNSIAVAP